ncbi:snRNA-activating protein of 50kDa MW C terminal-domain-containing protein [Phlyctochytrium arcticum]|nr:snRNA-activating protein of 50kDa MW C terminal-domain-containing protein [Phlyctochytrium arcticum]
MEDDEEEESVGSGEGSGTESPNDSDDAACTDFLPFAEEFWQARALHGEVPTLVPNDEVFTIQILRPNGFRLMTTIQLLGSHTLAVLRDAFYCPKDFVMLDGKVLSPSNEIYRKTSASLFFIENTCYIDERDPDAEDYSLPILEWLNDSSRVARYNLPNMSTVTQSSTCLTDLPVVLHKKYLFQHQGSCEHIFTISARTPLKSNDDFKTYPRMSMIKRQFVRMLFCQVCFETKAGWITIDDMRADRNPCLWCPKCYDLFHFQSDGSPAHDFEAHQFSLTLEP